MTAEWRPDPQEGMMDRGGNVVRTCSSLLVLFSLGCTGEDGSDPVGPPGTGHDGLSCTGTWHDVGLSEPAVDGHTGEEAIALLASPITASISWFDGRTESLTVTVTPTTGVVRANVIDEDDCIAGSLETDVSVHVSSDAGSLDETWERTLRWRDPFEDIDIAGGIAVEDLAGTFDWQSVSPHGTRLDIYLQQGVSQSGRIELLTTPNGTGPEVDTGSMFERVPVASWGSM